MLTVVEKVLFACAALASLLAAYKAGNRIWHILQRGRGKPDWKVIKQRLGSTLVKVITFQPVFRFRFWPSLFHAMIAWGFLYYLLVNLGDVLQAYLPGFIFFGQGIIGNLYRLGADILSFSVLAGTLILFFRRFVLKPSTLTTRQDVLLHPKARFGILRDSAIVSIFIFFHVGSRFVGESFKLSAHGSDRWQPLASALSNLWHQWSESAIVIGEHVTFWLAMGLILAFVPYFLYSKHIHIFFAPLNFLLKPARRSPGELSRVDFDDESIEAFGASRLEDLGWEQLMDAYACIMCFRCQEVCPAYQTGKVLSPAALEINKRYFLNLEGRRIERCEPSSQALLEFAIPAEAVWACTACGACIDICPVNNEPMRDILDIRRSLVLTENDFPKQLQTAFRGMERNVNPWNIPPGDRMKWAEGLPVPSIEQNPEPELLWWVGCAPATDVRAQKVARAFAKILIAAKVNFAVLGKNEQCTGDSARRAGNEYLFDELARANVEILNDVQPKRIVTTCPHCLHTLKNEYPAYGGHYTVIHHTQLINELIADRRISLKSQDGTPTVTFHDPCYLGRHNRIIEPPRTTLQTANLHIIEMPSHGRLSFCCGAGGAQMWKEEEHGRLNINLHRYNEAKATGAQTLAVACPFCMTMMNDAAVSDGNTVKVLDIAEIVAEQLK